MASKRANQNQTLGGAVFGETAPPSLALPAPLIHVPLPVLAGDSFDLWFATGGIEDASDHGVRAACGGGLCFGIVPVGNGALEDATRVAYLALFAYLQQSPCPHLLRIWNYLPRITDLDEAGIERYRRFNAGRHDAFVAAYSDVATPPAASALGTHIGQPCLFFLSATEPGLAIENPRQVSAYRYPEQYGRRSPSFSRSLLAKWGNGRVFLVSGTASIVGHETQHIGDVAAQTRETILNLRTLVAEAAKQGFAPDAATGRLKVYLRSAGDLALVDGIVAADFPDARRLYLRADICRTDLLVEIEAAFDEAD